MLILRMACNTNSISFITLPHHNQTKYKNFIKATEKKGGVTPPNITTLKAHHPENQELFATLFLLSHQNTSASLQ